MSGKVLAQRPHAWKVLDGTSKRYVFQVTILNDLEQKSKGQSSPSSKQRWPHLREGASLGLEEVMEVGEAMMWVLVRGGVKGVMVERDALCVTLKKMQT